MYKNNKTFFLAPSFIYLILLAVIPFVFMLVMSFREYSLALPEKDGQFIAEGKKITIADGGYRLKDEKKGVWPAYLLSFEYGVGIMKNRGERDNLGRKDEEKEGYFGKRLKEMVADRIHTHWEIVE